VDVWHFAGYDSHFIDCGYLGDRHGFVFGPLTGTLGKKSLA
jgi:hypothetical protein